MVENDRLWHEVVSESTGEVYSSRNVNIANQLKLTIPINTMFKRNQFLIDGASCSTLNYKLSGALSHLCHHYLHFDTLLLYKKDELGRFSKLKSIDFEFILELKAKAIRGHINELIIHKVLIKPSNAFKFYVNPRFIIRGGYISYSEFDMLLKHDPLILGCLDRNYLIQYKNWKIMTR